jgi:hypothetical protein
VRARLPLETPSINTPDLKVGPTLQHRNTPDLKVGRPSPTCTNPMGGPEFAVN